MEKDTHEDNIRDVFGEESDEILKNAAMTPQEIVDKVFGPVGVIYQFKPDYQIRPEQIEAIKNAIEALSNNKNDLLEGPCGFGKSFVYLFASMYCAAAYGKTVVIATNGITLQGQLFNKDAPLIARIIEKTMGQKVKVVYLKGRQNFLCVRKKTDYVADNFSQVSMFKRKDEAWVIADWASRTTLGDVSELPFKPAPEVWQNFACSEGDECLGKTCDHYDECFYNKAKKACHTADTIITNYHLLFADVETGHMVLPPYDILVCDEGHNMAEVSRNFQEAKVSHFTVTGFQRKLSALEKKYPQYIRAGETQIDMLLEMSNFYFTEITRRFRYPVETIAEPLPYDDFFNPVTAFGRRIYSIRNEICPYGEEDQFKEEGLDFELNAAYEVDALLERVTKSLVNIENICKMSDPNYAYYAQMEKNNMVSLRSKPVKVSKYMADNFFGKDENSDAKNMAAVVCSATLAAGESFDYIKDELGITESIDMIAHSPFDLENQQLWYLPLHAKDGNKEGFMDQMLDDFVDLVQTCRGGTLGLFTSVFNMRAAAQRLRQKTNLTIFMQGEAPQDKLLKDFAEDHDSVLIGTRSLFEGVDIPGQSLRCVFIDKLPFTSPEDPVAKKLMAEDGAFFRYSIPNMIIALKQAVGRGVRATTDKAVIAFGDGRLATANYRNRVLRSFNYTKTTTRDLDEVAKFLGFNGRLL